MSKELRAEFEKWAIISSPYIDGVASTNYYRDAMEAFDLLLPLIEAAEFYADQTRYEQQSKSGHVEDWLESIEFDTGEKARKALSELREKLGGGE